MRTFKHLTWTARISLEALLKAGCSVKQIAEQLEVSASTVYRERKRGIYTHLNSDLTEEERYSPSIAEEKYQNHLREKGPGLKIGNDYKLADYIEHQIIENHYSPAAVLGQIEQDPKLQFSTRICVGTLYSYIDKGIFLNLRNKHLPVKSHMKRRRKKAIKRQAKDAAGTSIEKRPEEIQKREEFGHWEMDTVKGKKGESENSLLVLSERMTRGEIIIKLPTHTSESVVEALNMLEHRWGSLFTKVFKTITVDNGSEFARAGEMEQSCISGEKRTKIYYCHPYSSYERGTNEVANRLIRRHIPKGTNFDDKTDQEILKIEMWINTYPRRLFGWRTAKELYDAEILKLLEAGG